MIKLSIIQNSEYESRHNAQIFEHDLSDPIFRRQATHHEQSLIRIRIYPDVQKHAY